MAQPYTIVGGDRIWANGIETTLAKLDAALEAQTYPNWYYADYTGPREIEARERDKVINGIRLQLWEQGLKSEAEALYWWHTEGQRIGQPKPTY